MNSNSQKTEKEKINILIVEDDKFLRELVAKKLESEGFGVLVASDGIEALEKIEKEPPQLILLDLILPNLDGFVMMEKMKENPKIKIKDIPIIVLSNLGQQEEIDKALKLGASGYMVKANFTLSEIVAKIKQTLKK